MINSIINFGSGPTGIAPELLEEISQAILNYNQSGLSILEIPHRGDPLFQDILQESKHLVLELCQLSATDYEVIWLQGGGRLQFAMIPMNFLLEGKEAAYVDSGHWAFEAAQNATYFGKTTIIASSKKDHYTYYPTINPLDDTHNFAYLHLCTNNTIYGTQIQNAPNVNIPLIADMSSDIFSVPRDYSKYDLFYAVAQKNIGAAGNTLVVIKKKMLEQINTSLAPYLSYAAHIKSQSVLNTAPVFNIYTSLLVLRLWKQRGLEKIYTENNLKAQTLYAEIKRNTLFYTPVQAASSSLMNVVFFCHDQEKETALIEFCKQKNIVGIKGHRSVGGFRVSLYNHIRLEQVQYLVHCLQEFEKNNMNLK